MRTLTIAAIQTTPVACDIDASWAAIRRPGARGAGHLSATSSSSSCPN